MEKLKEIATLPEVKEIYDAIITTATLLNYEVEHEYQDTYNQKNNRSFHYILRINKFSTNYSGGIFATIKILVIKRKIRNMSINLQKVGNSLEREFVDQQDKFKPALQKVLHFL